MTLGKLSVAAILAALVPVLGLLWMHRVDERRHADDLAALQRRIDDLGTAPTPPAGAVAIPFPVFATVPVASPPAAPAASAAVVERSATPAPEPSEIRDTLQIAFDDRRSAATEWGGQSRSVTTSRLTSLLPEGSALQSFECHAEMCRIETSHSTMEQYMAFARAAFMDSSTMLWNAPVYLTRLDDGAPDSPPVMVAYIAQPGFRLPQQ
jgi:hypothetical protein